MSSLPPPRRYITTHNEDGVSVFADNIPPEVPGQSIIKSVDFHLIYTTSNFPVDMTANEDVSKYLSYLESEKPGLTIKGGSVLRICDFAPRKEKEAPLMHRTVCIDYGIVLAGEMESLLDSGEKRLLRVGDIVIQRGTNHAWKNASQDKWARMIFVLQDALPLKIGSHELREEYGDIPGIAPSS